jgi:hypothetical protein
VVHYRGQPRGTEGAVGEGKALRDSGVRFPAALLVLAGPLGMPHYGPVGVLERADLLGIALFLVLLPPGPDRGGAAPTDPSRVAWATWCLRLLVGLSLIVVAFHREAHRPGPWLSASSTAIPC